MKCINCILMAHKSKKGLFLCKLYLAAGDSAQSAMFKNEHHCSAVHCLNISNQKILHDKWRKDLLSRQYSEHTYAPWAAYGHFSFALCTDTCQVILSGITGQWTWICTEYSQTMWRDIKRERHIFEIFGIKTNNSIVINNNNNSNKVTPRQTKTW